MRILVSHNKYIILTACFTFRRTQHAKIGSGSPHLVTSPAPLVLAVARITFPIASVTRQHGITPQFASLIEGFLHPLSLWCSEHNFVISPPISLQVNLEVLRTERLYRKCSHWLKSETTGGYQKVVDTVVYLRRGTGSGSTLRYLLRDMGRNSPTFLHKIITATSLSLERLLACIESETLFVENLLDKWTRASEGVVFSLLKEVCILIPTVCVLTHELSQKVKIVLARVDTLQPSRDMLHLPSLNRCDLARLSPGEWLNDEVVNLFAHHWDRTGQKLVVVLDSLFPTAYLGPLKDFEKEKLRLWKHNSLRVSTLNLMFLMFLMLAVAILCWSDIARESSHANPCQQQPLGCRLH